MLPRPDAARRTRASKLGNEPAGSFDPTRAASYTQKVDALMCGWSASGVRNPLLRGSRPGPATPSPGFANALAWAFLQRTRACLRRRWSLAHAQEFYGMAWLGPSCSCGRAALGAPLQREPTQPCPPCWTSFAARPFGMKSTRTWCCRAIRPRMRCWPKSPRRWPSHGTPRPSRRATARFPPPATPSSPFSQIRSTRKNISSSTAGSPFANTTS